MSSRTSRVLLTLLAGGSLCGVAHAERPEFGAFLDLQQVTEAQLSGGGLDSSDVTYTEVAGNVSGRISNRRIVASGTFRLSYRIPERGDVGKTVNKDGVMRIQANLIDEWLTADAGVIVTRSRIDPSGAAQQTNRAVSRNLTQTYSTFFQPAFAHRFGDVGASASYRYAYTKNEGRLGSSATTGPLTDRFDASTDQTLMASVGMAQSALPFDWQISAAHRAENATNLAKHTRAVNVIGDVKVPLGGVFALAGSAGYERTRISERKALVDPLTGIPVVSSTGRFIVDPASPRILTYDVDGVIADAGVIWRPSRHARAELRGGYRYGGASVTGLIEIQPDDRTSFSLAITDQIDSFGQGVSAGLAGSGPDLNLGAIDNNSSFQDCLFGKARGSGGSCLGSSLGGASAKSYRERGVNMLFTRTMRNWTVGASAGYARRTYIDDPTSTVSLAGVVDQNFFSNLTMSRRLTRTSGLSFSFTGNLFKNGQVGASDVMAGSFSSNYNRSFGRNIQLQANISVDASKQENSTADVSGRARVGLQYQF